MSELELKFHVQPSQRAGLVKALGNRKLECVTLLARYFDTPERLLARHGMTLRLRQEGEQWMQTLKASCLHTLERLEDNVALDAQARADPAGRDAPHPERHANSPVGARLLELIGPNGQTPLVEVFRTDVRRTRRLVRAHDALVEWALDEGSVVAGEDTRPISELELELKGGDPDGLFAMALDWQARHGVWLDVAPKAQRGDLLLSGRDFARPVKAEPPAWRAKEARRMSADAIVRTIVATCLAQILPNAGELAAGSRDPEHVHQLRIGLRRLRSALRELAESAPGLPARWEAPVVAVFEALGEMRDEHAITTSIAPRLQRAGAPLTNPAPPRDVDHRALAELVRGAAFQGVLIRLIAFSRAGPQAPPGDESGRDLMVRLRSRLSRLQRQVTRDAESFASVDFEAQHRVRKCLKRLRYLADFIAPLSGRRAVAAWMKAASRAQDALGHHVDVCLAAQRFEQATASDPRAWFAVGWLRAHSGKSARAACRSLQRLRRADVFW
jgi:triphosphatase